MTAVRRTALELVPACRRAIFQGTAALSAEPADEVGIADPIQHIEVRGACGCGGLFSLRRSSKPSIAPACCRVAPDGVPRFVPALCTLVASSDGDTGLRSMAPDEVEGFVSAPSSRGTLGRLPPMVLGPAPTCSVNPKISYPQAQELANLLFINTGRVSQDALHIIERDFKHFIERLPTPSRCNCCTWQPKSKMTPSTHCAKDSTAPRATSPAHPCPTQPALCPRYSHALTAGFYASGMAGPSCVLLRDEYELD